MGPPRSALAGLAALLLCAQPGLAHEPLDEDLWLWMPVNLELALSEDLLAASIQLQPRFDEDISMLEELRVRGSLGLHLVPDVLSVWAGYLWAPGFDPRYDPEHRALEQVQLRGELGPIELRARVRAEQRFFEGPDPVAHRVRTRFQVVFPLGPEWLKGTVWDEVFVNLNRVEQAGISKGVGENRLFGGLLVSPAEWLTIQVGYLNRLQPREEGPDTMDHVLFLGLTFKLGG